MWSHLGRQSCFPSELVWYETLGVQKSLGLDYIEPEVRSSGLQAVVEGRTAVSSSLPVDTCLPYLMLDHA